MKKTSKKLDINQSLVKADKPVAPIKLGGLSTWIEVKRVKDEPQFLECANALKHIKGLIDAVETERKELTKPLLEVKAKLDSNAKTIRAPAEALEKHLKQLLAEYEAKKRAEEIARAEKLAAKVENQSPQVAMEIREQAQNSLNTPVVSGLSFRRIRKARVENLKILVDAVSSGKVSIEHVCANEALLNALAKSTDGESTIPGVVFYEETSVASGKVGY